MSMKRFLASFVLIVLMTGCASLNYRWTKPNFNQDQFEKDNEECQKSLSQLSEEEINECLTEKGYKFEPPPMTVGNVLKIAVMVPVAIVILGLQLCYFLGV
jgi:hypothetical protein